MPGRDGSEYELRLDHRYLEAIRRAGGLPRILPITRGRAAIRHALDGIDGLVIIGGRDVDPRLYGEKSREGTITIFPPRFEFEAALYRSARRRRLPILGICYGMQFINVLEGGALFQDILRDAKSDLSHRPVGNRLMRVRIDKASRLARILGSSIARVRCDHHQAVSRVAPRFRPVAIADDGIIEAIESDDEEILAVQWHPERTPDSPATNRLFRAFIRLSKKGTVY